MPFVDPNMIYVPKAVLNGGVTALASASLLGRNVRLRLPYFGTNVNASLATFVIGASASLVTDAIHSSVVPHVHLSKKHRDQAILLLNAGIAGAMLPLGMWALNSSFPRDFGIMRAALVGGGSEIVSAVSVGVLNELL